jgi:hypothetical protein
MPLPGVLAEAQLRDRAAVRVHHFLHLGRRARVLSIRHPVPVDIRVARVSDAVPVEVRLTRLRVERAAVGIVRYAVRVDVRIASIARSVPIEIGLVRVRGGRAVVDRSTHSVAVEIVQRIERTLVGRIRDRIGVRVRRERVGAQLE